MGLTKLKYMKAKGIFLYKTFMIFKKKYDHYNMFVTQ